PVGRHVGQCRRALAAEHGEPAQLAILDVGHGGRARRGGGGGGGAGGGNDCQRRGGGRAGGESEPGVLLGQCDGEVWGRGGGGVGCGVEPVAGCAKLYLPGLAFTRSTSCLSVLARKSGCTEMTLGEAATSVIGEKSLIGS